MATIDDKRCEHIEPEASYLAGYQLASLHFSLLLFFSIFFLFDFFGFWFSTLYLGSVVVSYVSFDGRATRTPNSLHTINLPQ